MQEMTQRLTTELRRLSYESHDSCGKLGSDESFYNVRLWPIAGYSGI